MKITNGFFCANVRQRLSTPQSSRLRQLEATVRRRHVSDGPKGKSNGFFRHPFSGTLEYVNGCAATGENFSTSMTGVTSHVSSSRDTFTKQICTIASSSWSLRGCNTFANVTAPAIRCVWLNTGVPRNRVGSRESALFHSASAGCLSGSAKAVRTAMSHLTDNDSSIRVCAAESLNNHTDITMGKSHRNLRTFINPALPRFHNARHASPSCGGVSAQREKTASHEQVTTLLGANEGIQGITKRHVSEQIAASPIMCCSRFLVGPHKRLRGVQINSTSFKNALDIRIPTQPSSWLLLDGLRVSLPFMSFATRSFFFGKRISQTGRDLATSSCGSAALPVGQSAPAQDVRGTSSVVSAPRGASEILGTTDSTANAGTGNRESSGSSGTKDKFLTAGIAVQNSKISQLKVGEDERKLEQHKTSSGPWSFSPRRKESKGEEDALPNAGPTSPVKDKAAVKSTQVPFSKKIGSFLFGFFFASGCSFFIMYCQVADATLILQQIAKDATHRLAVLESRLLELEKRVRNF